MDSILQKNCSHVSKCWAWLGLIFNISNTFDKILHGIVKKDQPYGFGQKWKYKRKCSHESISIDCGKCFFKKPQDSNIVTRIEGIILIWKKLSQWSFLNTWKRWVWGKNVNCAHNTMANSLLMKTQNLNHSTHTHMNTINYNLIENKFSIIRRLLHPFASSYMYGYEQFFYACKDKLASITVP